MKVAFMSFSWPQASLAQLLSAARTYGYDGLEPRTGHAHGIDLSASASERVEIRRQAQDSGVALCCLALSCRYADPADVEQQVDETRRYVDLAADLEIPRLRVFGGKIPEGIGRNAAIAALSSALAACADDAQKAGVTICLETHDDWSDPLHVVRVMKSVDHAAVAVNWDVLHPVRSCGYSLERAFELLAPWIQHVHIHDATLNREALEFLPIGEGDIDHATVVRLLQGIEYQGYLSGEWISWEAPEVHLPRELAALRGLI